MFPFLFSPFSEKKLVTWLKLLFRTQFLVDYYYQDWSYVARTGKLEMNVNVDDVTLIGLYLQKGKKI